MLRFLLGLIGACALVAMMHKTIMAGGGYDHGDVDAIAATMLVVAMALAIVPIFRDGHWIVGLAVLAALVAGDVARFGRTFVEEMDRMTVLQAPAAEAVKRRSDAEQSFADALSALGAVGSTTPRIEAAKRAKAETEIGVREKTSERGCRRLCAAQLAAQMDSANAEVKAAHDALANRHSVAERKVLDTRAALKAAAVPPSVSPAADLIGWSASLLNAALAGLKSVALNLGSISMLAIAGHGLRLSHHPKPAAPKESAREQIARFALDRYQPDTNGQLLLVDAYSDYRRWCKVEDTSIAPVKILLESLICWPSAPTSKCDAAMTTS